MIFRQLHGMFFPPLISVGQPSLLPNPSPSDDDISYHWLSPPYFFYRFPTLPRGNNRGVFHRSPLSLFRGRVESPRHLQWEGRFLSPMIVKGRLHHFLMTASSANMLIFFFLLALSPLPLLASFSFIEIRDGADGQRRWFRVRAGMPLVWGWGDFELSLPPVGFPLPRRFLGLQFYRQ